MLVRSCILKSGSGVQLRDSLVLLVFSLCHRDVRLLSSYRRRSQKRSNRTFLGPHPRTARVGSIPDRTRICTTMIDKEYLLSAARSRCCDNREQFWLDVHSRSV